MVTMIIATFFLFIAVAAQRCNCTEVEEADDADDADDSATSISNIDFILDQGSDEDYDNNQCRCWEF